MPLPAPQQRARSAARSGYALSENIYCRGLYEVRRPDGTVYHVDATDPGAVTCDCPATVPCCKHKALVEIARRCWTAIDRRAAQARMAAGRARLAAMILADFGPSANF